MERKVADHVVIVVQVHSEGSEKHFGNFEPSIEDEELQEKAVWNEIISIVSVDRNSRRIHFLIGE